MAERGRRTTWRKVSTSFGSTWTADGEANPIDDAARRVEQSELMASRPCQYLRAHIGIAQIAAVEHQPVPCDCACHSNPHALAVDGDIGVERKDTARHRVGDAWSARGGGCGNLLRLRGAAQKPVGSRRLYGTRKADAALLEP